MKKEDKILHKNKVKLPSYDFEMDSDPNGGTLCGELGRKHRMKRYGPMSTRCTYEGCDGCY